MTTTINAEWGHRNACKKAASLLRELDGIGDGMKLDGQSAMEIADWLDEIADRIQHSYDAGRDNAKPQWKRRKFRAGARETA